MLNLLKETALYVSSTLVHNAPSLILGILIAAIIKVYVDPEKFKQVLLKSANVSIPGSVAFGAFTPFCACGTMAVIVSMLTTALPWGPIMAFLTSSPLMSPDGFVLISGIISFRFAVALAAASIIIGLGSGYITHYIEKNTHFLDNQARFAEAKAAASCSCTEEKNTACGCAAERSVCACSEPVVPIPAVTGCGCSAAAVSCCQSDTASSSLRAFAGKLKLKELFEVFYDVGVKKILVYFSIFAAVGYLINQFVPATLISTYLGAGNAFAVPFSALVGLPLYVSGSSSLPIIKSLMESGASGGAMLAFLITGPGTSAGVITGITTIMKKRAIALYVAYMLIGAILLGYLYDLLLLLGI